MKSRGDHCKPSKVPMTPFYKVTLEVSTSIDPKSPEFFGTLHKRIQSGYYVFVDAKAKPKLVKE